MTDEVTTTGATEAVTETTDSNPLINRPFVSPKPYDDDVFDSYEQDGAEGTPEAETEAEEPAKAEGEKPAEEEPVEKKEPQLEPDKIEDVSVKRNINGKEVEFKIKQAIDAYTKQEEFNRNMDRRVTTIVQRENAWKADQDNFKERVSGVIKAAQGGSFVEGIRALAKMAAGGSDLDVVAFEKQYFEQLDHIRDVYPKMTPEQQEAYWAKRALDSEKAKNDKFVEKENFEKSKSQLQQHVDSLIQQNSLTPDEFWSNYKLMVEEHVGEGRRFASPDQVTAEQVVAYSGEVKKWEKVYSAGEIAKIEDDAILDELSKVATLNPDYSAADLAKILQDSGIGRIADPATVENLNRKAGNQRFSQGSSTKKQNGKIEGLDEEDLDFLYRNQPKSYQRPKR